MYWENLGLGEPEDGGFSDVLLRAKLLASPGPRAPPEFARAPPLLRAPWLAACARRCPGPGRLAS